MRVLTGDEWLFKRFNGYHNNKNTAFIRPTRDKEERPILSTYLKSDPDFSLNLVVESPEGEEREIIDWLEEIDYEPKEIEE